MEFFRGKKKANKKVYKRTLKTKNSFKKENEIIFDARDSGLEQHYAKRPEFWCNKQI